MSDATHQAELLKPLVTGFLNPIYSARQPNGRHVHGLTPDDYDRVMSGYACGECCACFNTYMDVCPVCGFNREIAAQTQADPDQWNAYLEEHLNGSGRTQTRTAAEFIRDVGGDPDIEQANLSSIRPGSAFRKHRKG